MWTKLLVDFFVGLIKGILGERSRDKAHQVSGELAVENKVVEAANERAKDAKKVAEDISGLSDDELDKRMLDGQ